MANHEESNPLLGQELAVDNSEKKDTKPSVAPPAVAAAKESPPSPVATGANYGWTADGLPLGHRSVVGEPMPRAKWHSGLCACLGRNDEFCSSDLEVCILGSVAPCVLYGSNVERLGSSPGSFTNHCLTYSGLYFVGNSLFGWNCLAPWFSSPSRTAIRRKFNLEGSCELFAKPFGGLGSFIGDEEQREHCETTCDSTTHIFCHPCALCQEARELRRRLPHPGFNARPVFLMMPPGEQTMARGQLQENAI